MTCYFRHLNELFAEVRVEVTKVNKKDFDRKIHGVLGIEYKNCSATWKLVKARLEEDRGGFIGQLKAELVE